MIDTRYGPSLCTMAGVGHWQDDKQRDHMSVAEDDESEQSVVEFYELLLDALRETEHLDHVTSDSLIEASLTGFECFDRI